MIVSAERRKWFLQTIPGQALLTIAFFAVTTLLINLSLSIASAFANNSNQAMTTMADDHAARILRTSPEWASFLGVHDAVAGKGFRSRLSNYSEVENQRIADLAQDLLAELRTIPRESVDGVALITYDVLENAYTLSVRQNEFQIGMASVLGVNPPYVINQLFGPHVDLPRLFMSQLPLNNKIQIDQYLGRLTQVDRVMGEIVELSETDRSEGFVPPKFALEGAANAASAFIEGNPYEHPIVVRVSEAVDRIDNLSSQSKKEIKDRTISLVTNNVYPAYERFVRHAREMADEAVDAPGLWRLENGGEMYQLALEAYGANGLTAEEIHVIGQEDVRRIHAEMDAILVDEGLVEGSIKDRLRQIGQRQDLLTPNNDESKERLLEDLADHIDEVLSISDSWFMNLPPQPVEVRRIPAYEQDSAAGAYYNGPSLDGSRPGVFWINLKDTADWPVYTLKTLVYHEAVPGHHFQISKQQAISDMPLIRNMMFFSDFGEGWALYAEELVVEMGLYEGDPLSNLGRLRAEVYRSARLVVDTGIHHKGWSRQRAIDWMVEATGETEAAVRREIDRYSVWPGQATSYKLGMIQFQRLRAQAEAELGEDFDIRTFHEVVLKNGSMPMPVLQRIVDQWIANGGD